VRVGPFYWFIDSIETFDDVVSQHGTAPLRRRGDEFYQHPDQQIARIRTIPMNPSLDDFTPNNPLKTGFLFLTA
jgi:hypothetical protein